MRAHANRVKRLEEKLPPPERQFIAWVGKPWTPEEMAEAIRREPDCLIFWRSLLESYPEGDEA